MWIQKVPGGGVDALAFSPEGRTLYTLDASGALTAWDVAARSGRRLAKLDYAIYGITRGLVALADGRRVVVLANLISVRDAADGHELTRVGRPDVGPPDVPEWSDARVRPDGRAFARHPSGWQIAVRDLIEDTPEPTRGIREKSFRRFGNFDLAPDGRSVAITFGEGQTPTIFGWGDGPELRDPVAVTGVDSAYDVRFSPDGRTLALSTHWTPQLTLWDVADRRPRAQRVPCSMEKATFAFNPVFPLFAGLGADGALALRRLETGEQVRALDFMLGRYVRCVTFSPDGLTCAVGGSNKQFAVFDVDV